LRSLKIDRGYVMPRINAVFGVPGAGKSRKITRSYKGGDLVVSTTKSATESLAKHLVSPRYRKLQSSNVRSYVRTVDSYIMHGRTTANMLHFDEALMCHFADVLAVAYKCKAKVVCLYGDPMQLRFIQRTATFGNLLWAWYLRPVDVVLMSVSDRIPPSAAAMLANFYNGRLYALSEEDDKPKKIVCGYNAIPKSDTVQYITMYQEDKKILLGAGFKNVITSGEAQGETYEHVALVQVDKSRVPLFNSVPHVIVALSRHTKSFVFYTPEMYGSNLVTSAIVRGNDVTLISEAKYNSSVHGDVELNMSFEQYGNLLEN